MFGGVNYLSINDLCKSLVITDRYIRIEFYPIKSKYKNKKLKKIKYVNKNYFIREK